MTYMSRRFLCGRYMEWVSCCVLYSFTVKSEELESKPWMAPPPPSQGLGMNNARIHFFSILLALQYGAQPLISQRFIRFSFFSLHGFNSILFFSIHDMVVTVANCPTLDYLFFNFKVKWNWEWDFVIIFFRLASLIIVSRMN